MSESSGPTVAPASVALDRAQILRLLPQQGAMCLLERVIDWDTRRLLALGSDPNAPDHPLRTHNRLGSASALEYAAQAAAAHGALLGALPKPADQGPAQSPQSARTTLLASGRAVELLCRRLDQSGSELLIEVHRSHAEGGGALYEFELRAATVLLARGRLSLLLS